MREAHVFLQGIDMLDGPDTALTIGGLAFAVMGIGALAAPERVTGQFDIPHLTANGRNEVRAVYGGFGLAMAGMLGLAFATPDMRAEICLALAAALGGMAAGRVLSSLWDRQIGRWPTVYLAIECMGALLLLYAA
jgi:hypothetical protein